MSYYGDVLDFQYRFWPEYVPDHPSWEYRQQAAAYLVHAEEELAELRAAFEREDLTETLDAIVDAVYVLCGMAARLGLPFDQAWELVHAANMRKVRGPGKRGPVDVIKPPDWRPPDLSVLLDQEARHG